NLALHVDRDLARQVSARHCGRDTGDVADLRGQVRRHRVDRIGQVLPGTGHARHDRLTAKLPVGADFTCNARDLCGKAAQLIDHRVDGFFELEDFAADVDGDFLGQVAVGHRNGDVGNVADLRSEVARHL